MRSLTAVVELVETTITEEAVKSITAVFALHSVPSTGSGTGHSTSSGTEDTPGG